MLTSGIIDLAIGLAFVFGVTAALASAVTELIARLIGLRGAYLLSGLRELVDGGDAITDLRNAETDYQNMRNLMVSSKEPAEQQPPAQQPSEQQPSAAAALLGGPILRNQGVVGQLTNRKLELGPSKKAGHLPEMRVYKNAGQAGNAGQTEKAWRPWKLWNQCRSLPSYIPAKSFAEAVIDLLVPGPDGQTTMTGIEHNIESLPQPTPFKTSLEALAKNADNDISRFRTSVEQWYDDHMDRVSGWYKRYVAIITLAFGTILIVLLNLNALTIGRTLYTQSTVSTAISNVAAKGTNCVNPTPTPAVVPVPAPSPQSQQECLQTLQAQLAAAATAGLPIGWGTTRDCTEPNAHCNWWDERGIFSRHGYSFWQLVLVLIGFLIMIIAIVPGAQFWFGLLSMIGSLRATGPKPATPAGNFLNLTVTPPSAASTDAAAPTNGAAPTDAAAQPTPPPEPTPPLGPIPPPEPKPPAGSTS